MRILIAPNAFKNSLAAAEVAAAVQKGLQQSALPCDTVCFPVGDGGDGTGELLINYLSGRNVPTKVHDPLGRKIEASFGVIENRNMAIIEMAGASGLRLLQSSEYNPLQATSYGTGELIKAALDYNVKKIIICIGGSATVDGGTGMLQALGAKFCNSTGNELQQLPASLPALAAIDLQGLDKRLSRTEIIVLCDVENSLLGKQGAASMFGPQKGASPAVVRQLEAGLQQFSQVVLQATGKDISLIKRGGAAGGIAAALHVFLSAKLVNGIDYFLNITGFDNQLLKTDLVITGEGSIDAQTLQGKGPLGVAKSAKHCGLPVIGIGGKVPLTAEESLHHYFDVLLPIGNEVMDIQTAMQYTCKNLVRTGKMLGDLLALKNRW